jgi:hypothetical protein
MASASTARVAQTVSSRRRAPHSKSGISPTMARAETSVPAHGPGTPSQTSAAAVSGYPGGKVVSGAGSVPCAYSTSKWTNAVVGPCPVASSSASLRYWKLSLLRIG